MAASAAARQAAKMHSTEYEPSPTSLHQRKWEEEFSLQGIVHSPLSLATAVAPVRCELLRSACDRTQYDL